jgi:hypothetical protein
LLPDSSLPVSIARLGRLVSTAPMDAKLFHQGGADNLPSTGTASADPTWVWLVRKPRNTSLDRSTMYFAPAKLK